MKRSPLKRKTPLRKQSKRRKVEYKEYMRKRAILLEQKPVCELCNSKPSTQCHHRNGRNSKNYLDETTFMALCAGCHERIENNKSWARANGYLGKK